MFIKIKTVGGSVIHETDGITVNGGGDLEYVARHDGDFRIVRIESLISITDIYPN